MNLVYIGSGFVGACSAAVSADFGHKVLAYDVDDKKITNLSSGDNAQIEESLFEKDLPELILNNKERLRFTDDYNEVEKFLEEADAVFMCLPTPEKKDDLGDTDLSFYNQAAEKLAKALARRNGGQQEKYVVVVNKSTVPIDMLRQTEDILIKEGVKNFGIVSNPEFLAEGEAVRGSQKPERVVIGARRQRDFDVMRQIYHSLKEDPDIKYLEVSPEEAAAGKLLANYLLFNKVVTTFEVVLRLAEIMPGINYEKLRDVVSSDSRIGSWGFGPSAYAGGSCWIKDAMSLAHQMEKAGSDASAVRRTLAANNVHRDNFYERIKQAVPDGLVNKQVAVLGLAFKAGTNDVRNSSAIEIVNYLQRDGVKEIKVYDPQANEAFKREDLGEKILFAASTGEALADTDLCIILTDWPEFKELAEIIKANCQPPYIIADGRRMISPFYDELRKMGYNIMAVGESN